MSEVALFLGGPIHGERIAVPELQPILRFPSYRGMKRGGPMGEGGFEWGEERYYRFMRRPNARAETVYMHEDRYLEAMEQRAHE